MNSAQEDNYWRFKLAQLWHHDNKKFVESYNENLNNHVINQIINDDFNINYKVTVNRDPSKGFQNNSKDCTALHFLCNDVNNLNIFTNLLKRGADFTIKNGNGQTVLHLMMTMKSYDIVYINFEMEIMIHPFITSVLSAHIEHEITANPHDDNGLSHLHGACMVDHVEAVEWFLENGASVDETVNFDAQKFAGYSPLHFAADFSSFAVAQILVKRGASLNAKDAQGRSPLDLLINKKLNESSSLEKIIAKEEVVKLLLENNAVSTIGLSRLQVACTLKDLTILGRLLNQDIDIDYAVPTESPVCSGYTALDFAFHNSIDVVKLLLVHGVNINIDEDLTVFDFCIYKYSLQDLCDILSCTDNFKGILLSDGKTRLLDLISTMRNLDEFKSFLQNEIQDINAMVPADSVLWPGYTILHLAVILPNKIAHDKENSETQYDIIVRECLSQGLLVNVQNARGKTPIHLAFNDSKMDIVRLLFTFLDQLGQLVDVVDETNLSYLHIACAINEESLVEKLLTISDPNVKIKSGLFEAGTTPLHIAVTLGSSVIVDMLLKSGADLHATDAAGLTPIHCLLKDDSVYSTEDIPNVLFRSLSSNLEDHIVDKLGLTYLHVACYFSNVEAVTELINLGSNVNAVISYDKYSDDFDCKSAFERYSNHTPLHMATKSGTNEKIIVLLLLRGVDVLTKESSTLTTTWLNRFIRNIPTDNKTVLRYFWYIVREEDYLQKLMQKRFGLTMLHIACYLKDEEAITFDLTKRIDVNAQVRADSVIFAGCTPLHLLLTVTSSVPLINIHLEEFVVDEMVDLLLDYGADVTIANAEKDTPIHVFHKHSSAFVNSNRCKDLLLNAQKDFSVNPEDVEGLSHFHLACLWHEFEVVQKFLQHGSADVNKPIDYFIRSHPGCSPLHLALSSPIDPDGGWAKLSQTVDLLLKHGANVAAKDVFGETPLHKPAVLSSPEMSILDKLVSYGGDINTENLRGQTPIEMWQGIQSRFFANPPDYAIAFQKYNYKINRWNRITGEGYIGKIFLSDYRNLPNSSAFEEFVKSIDARSVDDAGRTAIHNAVAHRDSLIGRETNSYIYAIESFIKIGIDIDHQNKSGQTALHYAARMENANGGIALLASGADINIIDNYGKSAFSYAVEQLEKTNHSQKFLLPDLTMIFCLYIQKLQHLNLEVSQDNRSLVKKVQRFFKNKELIFCKEFNNLSEKFFSQIEMTKTLNIDTNSLTLYDFLCETGAASTYPLLSKSKREIVDSFFKSLDLNELDELRGIIKLQFIKMTIRSGLIHSALNSLRLILGFSVPDLCEQISGYLFNSDLENLIKSTISKSKKRKFSEITG